MNPGPIEEAGETARTTVTALSGTPALLSLILMQLAIFATLLWVMHERNVYETRLNELLVGICSKHLP